MTNFQKNTKFYFLKNKGTDFTELDETIQQAIASPFNFEIKKRILNRDHLDYLKSNPTYKRLNASLPDIKVNGELLISGNLKYKIRKQVGKGSYAFIYLIESQKDTCALKVETKYLNNFYSRVCYLYLVLNFKGRPKDKRMGILHQ